MRGLAELMVDADLKLAGLQSSPLNVA